VCSIERNTELGTEATTKHGGNIHIPQGHNAEISGA
jgi:hypothetical protein